MIPKSTILLASYKAAKSTNLNGTFFSFKPNHEKA